MTWRNRDDLSDTEVAILEMLADGRCTPAYIADEIDRSQEYVRERLGELRRLGLVESPYRGLYELADSEDDTDTREREVEVEPEPEPESDPQAGQIDAIVDAVSASWDDDGRLANRKAAGREALAYAVSNGDAIGKSHEIVDDLREEYPVEGQSRETYWRQNIRAVFAAMPSAEYSRGRGVYEVAGLCDVDELELE